MACLSSTVPPVAVYFVKFALMASMPARFTFSGVGKSGSPAPKSTTSAPSRRRRSAVAATFMVDDSLIVDTRPAKAGEDWTLVDCITLLLFSRKLFLIASRQRVERVPIYSLRG